MSEKLSFGERLKHGWNAFINPTQNFRYDYGRSSYSNPSRVRMTMGNEKSIVGAIYNRISLDVAALDIKHVILDESFTKVYLELSHYPKSHIEYNDIKKLSNLDKVVAMHLTKELYKEISDDGIINIAKEI